MKRVPKDIALRARLILAQCEDHKPIPTEVNWRPLRYLPRNVRVIVVEIDTWRLMWPEGLPSEYRLVSHEAYNKLTKDAGKGPLYQWAMACDRKHGLRDRKGNPISRTKGD